jgi:hypothetical protein
LHEWAIGAGDGAVASVHGAWLVNDKLDSPHRELDNITAEIYFAWADDDPTATVEEMKVMGQAKHRLRVMTMGSINSEHA